jgi:ESCRT-I complex subunit VPS37
MKEAYKKFTPSSLLFTLTQSASKLHDESESLANAFVEGLPLEIAVSSAFADDMRYLANGCTIFLKSTSHGLTPPDSGTATPTNRETPREAAESEATFVRRYRALRTIYHRRNLMADRWARGSVTWRDDYTGTARNKSYCTICINEY